MKKRLFFSFCCLFLLLPAVKAGIAGISREAFVDVPKDAYYYQPISRLVTTNLVIDVDQFSEDEYFYPSKPLTRAEFIYWTVQLFGLDGQVPENPISLPDTPSFSDVPKTHPAYFYIEIAKKYGLIAGTYTAEGKPTGKFEPEKLLTRAETPVILMRAFLQTPDAPDVVFPDLKNTAWAKSSIQKAVSLGFFSGYPDKTFGPEKPLLRADGITVLNKVFDTLKMNTLSLKYGDACQAVRGATFVSVEELLGGLNPAGPTKMHWTLSFGDKDYSWVYTDIMETGKYTCSGFKLTGEFFTTKRLAEYDSEKDILTWAGVAYERSKPIP